MSDETPTIDPRNNPESQVAEDRASQTGTRSTEDSGVVMSTAPSAEEGADGVIDGYVTGTSDSDVLAGVKATEDDVEEAVPGDTGPEHPGERSERP
ncbi:hypothetical protein [Mobilicoccus pelagius]|uniref:Uncharacterized protein n=1 Tax=Mobilicoccus pelagius NBRC 104925 TaxID=1089455 RepID=H5UR02_9MICO|nr:hypothetical protein [Mobilicoccus pelagius]GAB48160.1 hypothetical protein MOPEL_067_00090 [Mobilicoccus pelagius NBRC 104925]